MKNRITGYYSIFLGSSIIVMWLMILSTETPAEGKTEMTFHLFSEFLMAVICIVSGVLLLRKNTLGNQLNILGLGMVMYSVLNAAGYYGELKNSPMMIMFVVLFIITLAILLIQIRKLPD